MGISASGSQGGAPGRSHRPGSRWRSLTSCAVSSSAIIERSPRRPRRSEPSSFRDAPWCLDPAVASVIIVSSASRNISASPIVSRAEQLVPPTAAVMPIIGSPPSTFSRRMTPTVTAPRTLRIFAGRAVSPIVTRLLTASPCRGDFSSALAVHASASVGRPRGAGNRSPRCLAIVCEEPAYGVHDAVPVVDCQPG